MQLLTVQKLAEQFDVPLSWVYRRVRDEKDPLPKIKIGKYLRFDQEEIEAWKQKNR